MAEPSYKSADALFDRRRRLKANFRHEVVDMGFGFRHVAWLCGDEVDLCLVAKRVEMAIGMRHRLVCLLARGVKADGVVHIVMH